MNRIVNTFLAIMTVSFPAAIYAQGKMAVTAMPFMLKGEGVVNNVKLVWDTDTKARSYAVYRDNEKIAEVGGVMLDDYDLPVGKAYTYRVVAISPDGYKNAYTPVKATTFLPEGRLALYDNLDGKYLNEYEDTAPRGFRINGRYYRYSISRTDRNDPDPGWVIYESISPDGINGWSEPRLVYRHRGCNFEGNAFHFNPNTGKVVFSSHYEDEGGYSAAKIFLAEITPGGNLVVGTAERPLGYDSRDQSLFIDNDNTAYLLSATNMNEDINIYRLDKSWTRPVELTNTICRGAHRETPFILNVDGEYYFFSSKASGWYPSQTKYCYASDLKGEWSPLKEIGNNSTYDAQFNCVRDFKGTLTCWSYHWGAQRRYKTPAGNFPRITMLAFNKGTVSMPFFRYVAFNDRQGIIPVQDGRNLTLHKPVTSTVKGADDISPACITDGASCESDSFFMKRDDIADTQPYTMTVDMGLNARLREIDLTTRLVNGSECSFLYTIEGSSDNKTFEMLTDRRDNHAVGFQINEVATEKPFRYIRLHVHDIVSVHRDNSQPWADGIIELTAYGTPVSTRR